MGVRGAELRVRILLSSIFYASQSRAFPFAGVFEFQLSPSSPPSAGLLRRTGAMLWRAEAFQISALSSSGGEAGTS